MRYAAGAFNDKTPSLRVADLQFVLMSSNHRPIVMPLSRGGTAAAAQWAQNAAAPYRVRRL